MISHISLLKFRSEKFSRDSTIHPYIKPSLREFPYTYHWFLVFGCYFILLFLLFQLKHEHLRWYELSYFLTWILCTLMVLKRHLSLLYLTTTQNVYVQLYLFFIYLRFSKVTRLGPSSTTSSNRNIVTMSFHYHQKIQPTPHYWNGS